MKSESGVLKRRVERGTEFESQTKMEKNRFHLKCFAYIFSASSFWNILKFDCFVHTPKKSKSDSDESVIYHFCFKQKCNQKSKVFSLSGEELKLEIYFQVKLFSI